MQRFLQRIRKKSKIRGFDELLNQPAKRITETLLQLVLQSGDEGSITREHLSSWVAPSERDWIDALFTFLMENRLIETTVTDDEIGFRVLDRSKCHLLLAFLTDLVIRETDLSFTVNLEVLRGKAESGLKACASFLLATQDTSSDGGLSPFPRILEESGSFATFDMVSGFLTPLRYLEDLSPSLIEDYLGFLLSKDLSAHRSPIQALLEAILFGLGWQNLDGGFPPLADVLWVEDSYTESTGDAVVAMMLFSSFLTIADESVLAHRVFDELRASLNRPNIVAALRKAVETQHRVIGALVDDSSLEWEWELKHGASSVMSQWDQYENGSLELDWEALRDILTVLTRSSRYSAIKWLLRNYVEKDRETGYWSTRTLAPGSEAEPFWDSEGRTFATYFGWHALDLYCCYDATYPARGLIKRLETLRDNGLRWLVRDCIYEEERQACWSYRDRFSKIAQEPSLAMTAMVCSLLILSASRQEHEEESDSLTKEIESLDLIGRTVQWLENNTLHWHGTDEEVLMIGPDPAEEGHVYHITYSRKPHILWTLFDYYCLYLSAKQEARPIGAPITEISDLPISDEGKASLLKRTSFILGLNHLFKELENSEDRCCYERRSGFITPATSANAVTLTFLALILYFVCDAHLSEGADRQDSEGKMK